MSGLAAKAGASLLMAGGMFWNVGWSLVLGFFVSAVLQACVAKGRMQRAMGRDDARAIVLATLFGAASSSCSYASASIARTLFRKGAALTAALAFLLSSTNLVIELGIVLYLLMGWQFMLAEWLGGVVMVVLMAALVRLTYPARLAAEARRHADASVPLQEGGDKDHAGEGFWDRLRDPQIRAVVAHHFVMDWSMLWKDLAAGFLIAGALSTFIPAHWWAALFLTNTAPVLQAPAHAVTGVVIAVLSFVCSIGNVPMAAILWASGIGFGGVLAFLYADLIVLPLLDVYRRYFGWKMAAYIAAVFFTTMVLAALIMGGVFNALGLAPAAHPDMRAAMTHFSLNYTFWLNLLFGALALGLFIAARQHPVRDNAHACCRGSHRHGA